MGAVSKESLIAACILATLVGGAVGETAAGEDSVAALPDGVKAVWDLEKAQREATPTRERVCINGLWRWQPASKEADAVPAGGWGHFKVPGCWPGISDYMQKDCQTVFAHPSWQDEKLADVSAAWYQREITVPDEWTGRRIVLEAEYVNSLAVVYIDGKKAGQIRFPAGDLDLSTACRPGGKHLLSILVVAMPLQAVMLSYNDTASARQVKGRVARRGLCGDVFLASEPKAARISDVKVDTSVRNSSIGLDVALEGLSDDAKYVVRVLVTDGERAVLEFGNQPFRSGELQNGRIRLVEKWKPEKLWDVHTPENMYQVQVFLTEVGGRVEDVGLPVRFGFREFWIDGRDFYLNGKRIFLSSVPLDNAQIGAAWATYDAARESLQRLNGFGINFVYTHNYGCEPGSHLSFEEALRAADDTGMLIALSQPHFAHYDWDAADADLTNGYARHAEFYVRVAQNHPSVVFYSTSHNATGYAEDMNPDLIDGKEFRRSAGSARNVARARRAEAIIQSFDSSRIVYHHSSGSLGSMHTVNFYTNFVPTQEMSDWFEHWATEGVKPIFTCEYTVPMSWDWTMYRGWYQGTRTFGSATVPWEFCLAQWNAQFFGDRAYRISEEEKENLRWEAKQFRSGRLWHRWDYPNQVGSRDFAERFPVYAMYFSENWPAFRTWGMSANSPWSHGQYWTLREGVDKSRRELSVDWDDLGRPGFSPDYIDERYERIDLAFEREDWIPTLAAKALLRYNLPLLGYIAGKPTAFTSKDHNFRAGETVQKQLIVINNSREPVRCDCEWSLGLPEALAGKAPVSVAVGGQERIPLRLELPGKLSPGNYNLKATFRFSTGEQQTDSFAINVLPPSAAHPASTKIALFDPKQETGRLLDAMGIKYREVNAESDLSAYDVLVVGKHALSVKEPAPDVNRVRQGLKVLLFEQSPEVLEGRFGFRVATYGLRRVFKRVPDHPVLAGLDETHLRNWRGEATTVPPRLDYRISRQFGAPTVKWAGIPVTRLWRCGNRGNLATALIEKPARGDFLPILDGGYGLQYSPLMEYRQGKGMLLFCQMDVTGRTEQDPAAETLARNLLEHVAKWKPAPRRTAVYVGTDSGKQHLESAGVSLKLYQAGKLAADDVLVVGSGGGKKLAADAAAVADWIKTGGHVLALGLDEQEAKAFLPMTVEMKNREHIATYFEPLGASSFLAGVGPAEVHNSAPRELPLVSAGVSAVGNGVLATANGANVVFCQIPPYGVSKARGTVPSLVVSEEDAVEGTKSALVTMGTIPWGQFGQNVDGVKVGKTYTFAVFIKGVGGPVQARLEIERAGSPWDRVLRGEDTTLAADEWTELHATFKVDKPYPEGWTAYVHCGQEGGQFRADRFRLYEGDYVPGRTADGAAGNSAAAQGENVLKNPSFEDGADPWSFTYRTEQGNLKRTYRRTCVLLSRLLGNMGVAGGVPLLERFSTPVGGHAAESLAKNGDFSKDADGDDEPDEWAFSGSKGAACTRQPLGDDAGKWSLLLSAPPIEGEKKPNVMLAQHDIPIIKGQWYRISLNARAEDLEAGSVTATITNMANWRSLLPYERFSPGAKWEKFSFEAQASDTVEERTRFQIWYTGEGKLWLADVRVEPIADPTEGRWLEGFYLDTPEEWDDPYRFFRW